MLEPDFPATIALRSLLDASEQARADRFRFAADRDCYIVAHALLRTLLSKVGGIAAEDWRFQTAAGGKPVIDPTLGRPELRFSLSHTHGMAACAVGHTDDLGIDAEAWKEPAPLEIAQRFFSPTETALIARCPSPLRAATFYRLWTLKEAYLKATGQGIAVPLDTFSFSLDPISIDLSRIAADRAETWHFAEYRPGPAHALALAVRRPTEPVSVDSAAVSPHYCLEVSAARR